MTQESSIPDSEQGKINELLNRKQGIWNEFYLKGNFAESKMRLDGLFKTALEWQADSETMTEIIADRAWTEYLLIKMGQQRRALLIILQKKD